MTYHGRAMSTPEESGEPPDASGVSQDEALLEALRRGDGDAFERIAREQAPRLYRFAMHLTGRREDAEDLVQETLVRALRTLPRFEGRSALSTYLLRALGNIWKNRLRSRSRSRVVEWFRAARTQEPEGEPDAPDPAPSPLQRMESRERETEVRRALDRLEPDRRMALLLREMEGLSYEEIAEMTGVPIGTVRSRIARGRDDLRRLLKGRV